MDREVWVEAQSVDSQQEEPQAGVTGAATGAGRWRRLAPRRRLALTAIVSASVAATAVVGGLLAGLPVSATTAESPVAAVVVSPETAGATGATVGLTTTSTATSIDAGTSTTAVGSAAGSSSTTTTTGRAGVAPGSIRDVDLADFSYPSSVCVPGPGEVVTFADGVAGATAEAYVEDDPTTWGSGLRIAGAPTYGDVTGDGIDDAVVRIECYYVPGETDDASLAVVSMTPDGPAVVSTLDDAGVTHQVTDEYGTRDVTYDYALVTRAVAGQLEVDWLDHSMGGRYTTTATHRFDGRSFAVVGDSGARDTWTTASPTPDPWPSPDTWGRSIEQYDLATMTVPVSDGRTCGSAFADLGPLADVRLGGGEVYDDGVTHFPSEDVLTADGRSTDARVFFRGAGYKELTPQDGQNELELVVMIGCVRGDTATSGLLVLRHSANGPEVIGWVFGPGPVPGASSAWAWKTFFDRDFDLVVEWGGEATYTQRLWWDGASFVEVPGIYCHL